MNDLLFCCTADIKPLDRYIHAVTICNSLALLVSRGSPEDFAIRVALLTTLQKCWLNGHLVLKLECSCDGTIDCISDVILHDLNTSVTSDLGIHITDDVKSLSDVQSAEQCDNIDDFEAASDFTTELKSNCLNTSENTEEKSVVSTDGSESMFCFVSCIICILLSIISVVHVMAN